MATISDRDKQVLNDSMRALLRMQGYKEDALSFEVGSQLAALHGEPQAAVTYYVETTGNNASDGLSQGAALLNWDGVLAKLKARYPSKRVTENVVVNFGIGNFAGVDLSGWTFDPAIRTAGASLLINGTLVTATPASGAATGSFTSAANGTFGTTNTFATATKSTEAWTVNDFRGKLIEITSGTAVGVIAPIVSNTSTAITACLATWTGGAPSTSGFAIRDWGTVFTTAVVQPTGFGSATLNSALAHIADNRGVNRNIASIRFQNVKFSASSGLSTAGVLVSGQQARVSFQRTCFNVTQALPNLLASGKGSFDMTSCVIDSGATNNAICLSLQNGTQNQSPGFILTNCMFRATGTGTTGLFSQCYTDGFITACDFNAVTAASFAAGAFSFSQCRLTGATAALAVGANGFGGSAITLNNCDLTSAGVAINVVGLHALNLVNVVSGSGSGTAILAKEGARVKLSSGSTITGTVEIQFDATTGTIAAMRAASPKLLTNTYGSIVYE